MHKRVLVTGDLGFVGQATCMYPSDLTCIGYDLMHGYDIRDLKQLVKVVHEEKPDAILHLAAIARFSDADANPKLCYDTNVEGTRNVVKVCGYYHIPLVYASTGSAIMPLDNFPAPYTEDIQARGNSLYGCSKALGEYIVREHTPHIILRYAHIYGPEKRGHGLIGGYIDRINRGLQPRLFGGRQTNDFTYIDDIAQANILALTASWDKWNQTYHIGTGEELSAAEAGDIICEVLGYDGGIDVVEARTVDPGRFVFDISKARRMLGYAPKYSFREGLQKMIFEIESGKVEKAEKAQEAQ